MADATLRPEIAETMGKLQRELATALGDRLESIVVYGSAARGDWRPESSDVNVLIIVSKADRETLDVMEPTIREIQADMLVRPLVTTSDELSGAADTYPVLFFDLQRHHVVVLGDEIELPSVAESHLRLRVEEQLRDFGMTLRSAYLRDREYPRRLAKELEERASGLHAVLEALVFLETREWPADRRDAARRAAELVGAKSAALVGLHGPHDIDETITDVYEELLDANSRLVTYVDGMELW